MAATVTKSRVEIKATMKPIEKPSFFPPTGTVSIYVISSGSITVPFGRIGSFPFVFALSEAFSSTFTGSAVS